MLINKADLLPHVEFDVDRCFAHARRVNPDIEGLVVSATRAVGPQGWPDWLLPLGGTAVPALPRPATDRNEVA